MNSLLCLHFNGKMKNIYGVLMVFVGFLTLSFEGKSQGIYVAQSYIDQLSAPNMHGRGYVDSGDHLAANFVANQFSRLGLKPLSDSYFQNFNLDVNVIKKVSVKADSIEFIPGIHYIVSPGSPSFKGNYDLKYISFQDLGKKNILKKMKKWFDKGCITILPFENQNEEVYKIFLQKLKTSGNIPVFIRPNKTLIYAVARKQENFSEIIIDPEFFPKNTKKIYIEIESEFKPNYQSQNVIGMIPGNENRDSFVIICGHYDHLGKMGDAIYHGANDNASGIAMMLDLAFFFKNNPQKNNIIFIAFGGEEAGLVGSSHFVKRPTFPIKAIKFVLNLDLMGSGEDGIMVVNGSELDTQFNFLEKINENEQYVAKVGKRNNAPNSDHYPFTQKGIPAFFIYTMGDYKYYHSPMDNADNLQLSSAYSRVFALLYDFIETINK